MAQEVILYLGGKQTVSLNLFDVFNLSISVLLYPGQV